MNHIIYHDDDLDGRGSAAIALRALGEATLWPVSYDSPLPEVEGDVYLLDFSFPPEQMLKLCQQRLTYIDHHAPRIKELREAGVLDRCYCARLNIMGTPPSAISLTWKYFHLSYPPPWVTLLSDYDASTTRFGSYWENDVLPFQYGMKALDTNPRSKVWNDLPGGVAIGGRWIMMAAEQEAKRMMGRCYWTTVDGMKALCYCGDRREVFDYHPDRGSADLFLLVSYNGRYKWTVWPGPNSDLHVGEWAQRFGGGGHKGCGGFYTEVML